MNLKSRKRVQKTDSENHAGKRQAGITGKHNASIEATTLLASANRTVKSKSSELRRALFSLGEFAERGKVERALTEAESLKN